MMYSQGQIQRLTDECCDNIDDVLNELNVSYRKQSKRYYGPCPVHDGDNPAAWNLYPEGEEVRGYWCCRTHACEKKWKKNLVGFLHGVLSREAGTTIPWYESVNWMARFLGYKKEVDVVAYSQEEVRLKNESRAISRICNVAQPKIKGWKRLELRRSLQIPAQYYLERGYSRDILDKYDVGYLDSQKRIVVPVYDTSYTQAVGFTKRSIYEKCSDCGYFHCPTAICPIDNPIEQFNSSKWKNSEGFESAHYLYNYWFARESIIKSQTMVVVEGPGDVWRLEEAGVHNAVAIFGVDITEEQLSLIESSWAMNIIVWLDNDDAGKNAAANIKKQLGKTHRLYFPCSDIEAGDTDIKSSISTFTNTIYKLNKELGVS